jgi:hypothetical protein
MALRGSPTRPVRGATAAALGADDLGVGFGAGRTVVVVEDVMLPGVVDEVDVLDEAGVVDEVDELLVIVSAALGAVPAHPASVRQAHRNQTVCRMLADPIGLPAVGQWVNGVVRR